MSFPTGASTRRRGRTESGQHVTLQRACIYILMFYRKRLEHDDDKLPSSKVDPNQGIGDVQDLDVDTRSIMQIEVPPWSESYELSSTDGDGALSLARITVEMLMSMQTNSVRRSSTTNIAA